MDGNAIGPVSLANPIIGGGVKLANMVEVQEIPRETMAAVEAEASEDGSPTAEEIRAELETKADEEILFLLAELGIKDSTSREDAINKLIAAAGL